MNAIQKATFAASALAITCLGAALVTAPMAFARQIPALAQNTCATSSLQSAPSDQTGCTGYLREAGLVALNRR